MAISTQGRRKITVDGRSYLWWVRHIGYDQTAFEGGRPLFVVSTDKPLHLVYGLAQQDGERFLISRGNQFKGRSGLGEGWRHFPCPSFGTERTVGPKDVAALIQWANNAEEPVRQTDGEFGSREFAYNGLDRLIQPPSAPPPPRPMGCDIHRFAERRAADGTWTLLNGLPAFDERNYALFGWLADVRNHAAVGPLVHRRGMPADASPPVRLEFEEMDFGHATWYGLDELLAVDYDATVENRRITRRISAYGVSGACTAPPGQGVQLPLRAFLGPLFFADLAALQTAGAQRVVYGFAD